MTEQTRPSRRIVFQGLGALGVAAVLAGCGEGDDPGNGEANAGSTTGGDATGGTGNGSGSNAEPLATTSEIPVGGGVILADHKIVLTQPTEGEFKGYSAICKHQGFDVTRVDKGEIICDVHGSRYDVATGEVTSPPAPAPLDEVAIKVEGGRIYAA